MRNLDSNGLGVVRFRKAVYVVVKWRPTPRLAVPPARHPRLPARARLLCLQARQAGGSPPTPCSVAASTVAARRIVPDFSEITEQQEPSRLLDPKRPSRNLGPCRTALTGKRPRLKGLAVLGTIWGPHATHASARD